MSDQKTMVPEVKAALLAADVSEETIAKLEAAGYTTAASLAGADKNDFKEIEVIPGDRAKIKNVYPTVEATVTVHEEEEVEHKAPPAAVGKYDSILQGASSIGLNTAAIMATHIDPEFLDRGAMAISTFIVCGTGVDRLLTYEFFTKLGIKKLSAADAAYAVGRKIQAGAYISEGDLNQMFGRMPNIFGDKWMRIMGTTRELAAAMRTNSLMAGTGQFTTNSLAPEVAELTITLPSVAESVNKTLISGPIPVMAKPATEMVQDIMTVLKMRDIQLAAGVVNDDPDAGAMEFLEKYFGAQVATSFRLAVVAERLVRLLGVCPQSDLIDQEYLFAFGKLAVEYRALHALVNEGAAVNSADSFRPAVAVASVQPTVETVVRKRWSIDISLRILKQ